MNITVRKEQRGWWERLTAQERKPVFLAPDFDRWLDESDAEMEIREKVRFKFKSLLKNIPLTLVLKSYSNITTRNVLLLPKAKIVL